eukprot:CAMPEP_0182905080 /NCGR_PEP_ID=MMETSP0034_2-20130328/32650_1 /TAXON_ID=156128 /ORGANISM="Nephroselmis pyriformis, Strain CCMP717" /LENGTH=49 /DNA_ID=CAMNT_0025040413 /DNA_START=14 /DNA_END=163 /DNA_ORIENTATION=+
MTTAIWGSPAADILAWGLGFRVWRSGVAPPPTPRLLGGEQGPGRLFGAP